MTTHHTSYGTDSAPLSRNAMWFTILAFAVAWAWIAVTTPAWGDKWVFLAVLGAAAAVIAGLFLSWNRVIPRVSDRWIWTRSPEQRDYWTAPGNRAEFSRRLVADLEWIGAATLVLFTVLVLVVGSADGAPAQPWSLVLPIALFAAAIVGLLLYMTVGPRYRPLAH